MIWGPGSVTDTELGRAAQEGTHLLGFNEPDLPEQANMSVEQALDLWPRLESTGLRLGAPAVAAGGDVPGGWLDRFMKGAAERGLRVDFIPLHWYGGDFGPGAAEQLRTYLQAVHDRYDKPVWLTEYGLIDFSQSRPATRTRTDRPRLSRRRPGCWTAWTSWSATRGSRCPRRRAPPVCTTGRRRTPPAGSTGSPADGR
ncbi:hypothetical protein SHKM778_83530 [Streptomyces sp. KM77-8]|uniref:Asl1-like glycosyl hydrolase catalytic domain-containing protein n=1 Tax=Streptomyces haneummycinicus TaxID=3074435 RepID=A0AAT9HWZ3_9ACTN